MVERRAHKSLHEAAARSRYPLATRGKCCCWAYACRAPTLVSPGTCAHVCLPTLQTLGTPTCHFFNSFFFNKLYKDSGNYNYNEVRRWTLPKRLKTAGQPFDSILDCDRIIIPANQRNTHWVCAMIDLRQQRFVLYDSMAGEDHACLDNLARYLVDEYKNKRDEDVSITAWLLLPQLHVMCAPPSEVC